MSEHPCYHYTPEGQLASAASGAAADTIADAWIAKHRDLWRNGDAVAIAGSYGFNQGLPNPRYIVSDIAKFHQSNRYGYAFVIRDTTEGCEWLIVASGANTTSGSFSPGYYILPGYNSVSDEYAQWASTTPDNTGYSSNAIWAYAVYFNPDYATDTFSLGFDDAVNLTYTLGDFSSTGGLPVNTGVAVDAFMPSTLYPRGFVLDSSSTAINGSDLMCWIDEANTTFCAAMTSGADGDPALFAATGLHQDPDDVGDAYEQGTMWVYLRNDNDDANDPVFGEGYVDAFTPAGARVHDLNIVVDQGITRANEKNVSDEFKWYYVTVQNGTLTKGVFKSSFAREALAFDDRARKGALVSPDPVAATEVYWKLSDSMIVRYPAGIPAFPFGFPNKD